MNQTRLIFSQGDIKKLKKQFISRPYLELHSPFDGTDEPLYGVVYKLTNLANGKIYIGKTTQFPIRVMAYLHAYTSPDKSQDSVPEELRQDIQYYGIEKFDIHIIAYAYSPRDLAISEAALIRKYNPHSLIHYNQKYEESFYRINDTKYQKELKRSTKDDKRREKGIVFTPNGLRLGVDGKKKKSKEILAFDFDHHKIFRCDGLAAFGLYTGHSRSMVKNYIRRCIPIKGKTESTTNCQFYLMYIDEENLQFLHQYLLEWFFAINQRHPNGNKKISYQKFYDKMSYAYLLASYYYEYRNFEYFPRSFHYFTIEYDSESTVKCEEIKNINFMPFDVTVGA